MFDSTRVALCLLAAASGTGCFARIPPATQTPPPATAAPESSSGEYVATFRLGRDERRERRHVEATHALLYPGRMELGFSAGMNYWSARTHTDSEDMAFRASRAYVNPAITLGAMVTDRLQVRVTAGYQYSNASFQSVFTDYNHALTETAQVVWYAPMPWELAFYAGGGIGAFQGGSYRPAEVEDTYHWVPTYGVLALTSFGIIQQPTSGLLLRAGFRGDLGAGFDDYDELKDSERARGTNSQLVLELGASVVFN